MKTQFLFGKLVNYLILWLRVVNKKQPGLLLISFLIISGCSPTVKVEPPDKPITVNLNVNVEHKLKVQMDRDIDQIMKNNPDLF